jgi:Flp pilus assembly protein TadG
MLFGIVDVSVAVFVRSCLQNAVREGVRYAITYQSDAAVKTKVQSFSLGFLTGTNASLLKVNYYTTGSTTPIVNGGNVPGNIVEVSVQNFPWNWLAPVSPSYSLASRPPSFSYSVYAYDVMGGTPAGGAPAR